MRLTWCKANKLTSTSESYWGAWIEEEKRIKASGSGETGGTFVMDLISTRSHLQVQSLCCVLVFNEGVWCVSVDIKQSSQIQVTGKNVFLKIPKLISAFNHQRTPEIDREEIKDTTTQTTAFALHWFTHILLIIRKVRVIDHYTGCSVLVRNALVRTVVCLWVFRYRIHMPLKLISNFWPLNKDISVKRLNLNDLEINLEFDHVHMQYNHKSNKLK